MTEEEERDYAEMLRLEEKEETEHVLDGLDAERLDRYHMQFGNPRERLVVSAPKKRKKERLTASVNPEIWSPASIKRMAEAVLHVLGHDGARDELPAGAYLTLIACASFIVGEDESKHVECDECGESYLAKDVDGGRCPPCVEG